jgi:hypothetical protein
MPDTIRVRAVDGAVVFAIEPSGRVVTPLRAIGRDGQSALSPKREFEDVPNHPVIRGAIAAGSLEQYEPEPEAPADAPEPSKENA